MSSDDRFFKRTKASYRVKKHFYKPREAWSVHENDHEPIIAEPEFELVQELMARDTRVSGDRGQLQMFSGLIICGACGQPMIVKTTKKNGKSYVNYICSTHKKHGTCRNNNISARRIEDQALLCIRSQISALLSAEELSGGLGLDELKSRRKIAIEDMIEKSLRSIQEYNDYLIKSYTHHLDGVITEDEYRLFREDFRRQIDDAEKSITHLRNEIERLADDSTENQAAIIKDYVGDKADLNLRGVITDLGYTGRDFDRPGYIELMEGIKRGDVGCVIVKDLSLVGRTYIEVVALSSPYFMRGSRTHN